MKKDMIKNLIIIIFVLILLSLIFLFIKSNNKYEDTVKYNGKTYVLLEYNMDIFYYDYNISNYYEEDIIHPVFNEKWDVVYFNGDLFVLDSQVRKATKYYSNDENYEWFIIYEVDEKEVKDKIKIILEKINYLYNMENINKDKTMKFEYIKKFVDIVKISKDGFIKALINLVHYDNYFYWKTEIMNDKDEEYIIKLPDSLNNKIFSLLEK